MFCNICKRMLDNPNDPTTKDCGGDCLRCMANFDDPDAVKGMAAIRDANAKGRPTIKLALVFEGGEMEIIRDDIADLFRPLSDNEVEDLHAHFGEPDEIIDNIAVCLEARDFDVDHHRSELL